MNGLKHFFSDFPNEWVIIDEQWAVLDAAMAGHFSMLHKDKSDDGGDHCLDVQGAWKWEKTGGSQVTEQTCSRTETTSSLYSVVLWSLGWG